MIEDTQNQMSAYNEVVRFIWNGAENMPGADKKKGISFTNVFDYLSKDGEFEIVNSMTQPSSDGQGGDSGYGDSGYGDSYYGNGYSGYGDSSYYNQTGYGDSGYGDSSYYNQTGYGDSGYGDSSYHNQTGYYNQTGHNATGY